MKLFRALSTTRLVALIAVFAALVAGIAALAVAATGGGGPTPPPKPLAHAIHDALAGPEPDGITATSPSRTSSFHRGRLPAQPALRPEPVLPAASGRRTTDADGSSCIERRRRPDRLERRQGHRLRRDVERRLLVHAPEEVVERYGHRRQGSAAGSSPRSRRCWPTSRSRPPSPARSPTTSRISPHTP